MRHTRREVLLGVFAATRLKAAQDDVTRLTLREVSDLLRMKQISATELTTACLARIQRHNSELNAFITIAEEAAMADARRLDSSGARGPLHGIPVAIKDMIDTQGLRTTAGSALFEHRIPRRDAEVVRRLKAAGAIILGKLNTHEFAFGATNAISHFGPVHNPWDRARIAGGSSGGAGAAVAAGLCYAAIGTDTGGSVRIPAAFCGVAGLKPTYGRVSTRGVIPLAASLDTVGPLARSVEDAAMVLQVISGYDKTDPASANAPVPNYVRSLRTDLSGFNAGIPRGMYRDIDPEIQSALDRVLKWLTTSGVSIRDVELPSFPEMPLEPCEAWTYHQEFLTKSPELYDSTTRKRIESGRDIPPIVCVKAKRSLKAARTEIRRVFANFDVLVSPTVPVLPATIEDGRAADARPGLPVEIRNTRLMNVFGLPAISIPCAFSRSGLPIGLQLSAAPFAEERALAVAHAYEQGTDWHKRIPQL
jgi:aspartyl-tRNA(Asn)/glutamyl-tRNA(Gln) amidotransferase subunit A